MATSSLPEECSWSWGFDRNQLLLDQNLVLQVVRSFPNIVELSIGFDIFIAVFLDELYNVNISKIKRLNLLFNSSSSDPDYERLHDIEWMEFLGRHPQVSIYMTFVDDLLWVYDAEFVFPPETVPVEALTFLPFSSLPWDNFWCIEFNMSTQDPEAKAWYKSLKVPWRPSGVIYRPIWTFLYTGTGYAAYLVLVSAGGFNYTSHIPLINWVAQLLVNLMWGHLMFKHRRLELALANRLVLVFLVFLCAWGFACINPHASQIMYGYLLWCLLSMSHNYNIWKLNPEHR